MGRSMCKYVEDVSLILKRKIRTGSSLHSGWSLARDHIGGDLADPCGVIADFCSVIACTVGYVAIGDSAGADADRCMTP